MKRLLLSAALFSCTALPAMAAGIKVDVEIPQLDVAEYHRPYVAIWIEREDSSVAANLAAWYQQERAKPRPNDKKNEGAGEPGTKWLPDLRQWWRRSGRALDLPVDGVTGATRPVGTHTLEFDAASPQLKDLAPGNYRLVVEAAREVGGRELLKLPFAWPPTDAASSDVQGKTEFGRIALSLTP